MARKDVTIGPRQFGVTIAAAVAVAAAAIAVGTVGTSGGAAGEANIFVELGAGACTTASASQIAYSASATPDRRCGTLDQANDAMSNGQLACIRPNTYPGQLVTGNKTASTTMKGCDGGVTFTGSPADPNSACPNAPGVDPFQTGILCVTSNFFTLENVTIDCGATIRDATCIGQANGADVTFRDVNFHGQRPSFQAQGDRFHWDGGEIGASGQAAGQRWCGDGNPMTLNGDGTTIENLTIWPQGSDQTPYTPTPCGGSTSDNGFHLENIRIESANNITVRRVNFKAGSEAGSGHIFITGSGSGPSQSFIGNYFGLNSDGSSTMQINATVTSCTGWVVAYNTWTQSLVDQCTGGITGSTWTGNLMVYQGCLGTRSGNVYQHPSIQCTGDLRVNGPAFDPSPGVQEPGTGNLGFDTAGHLQAGSPAIDAAGSTCPTVTPDLDGTARPVGSACDAGADEYTGG